MQMVQTGGFCYSINYNADTSLNVDNLACLADVNFGQIAMMIAITDPKFSQDANYM